MTESMRILFHYITEKRICDFLHAPCDRLYSDLAEEQESALLDTLTDTQKVLWNKWYDAQMAYNFLYEQALFQAAFALAKELG